MSSSSKNRLFQSIRMQNIIRSAEMILDLQDVQGEWKPQSTLMSSTWQNPNGDAFPFEGSILEPLPILSKNIKVPSDVHRGRKRGIGECDEQLIEPYSSFILPTVFDDDDDAWSISTPSFQNSNSEIEFLGDCPTSSTFHMTVTDVDTDTDSSPVKKEKKQKTSHGHKSVASLTSKQFSLQKFQAIQWHKRFQDLVDFRVQNGHCRVPSTYIPKGENADNKNTLSQWIKRQRYQFKLQQDGKHSTLTTERKEMLDGLGFCWNLHSSAWDIKLEALKRFQMKHGHVDVPSNYAEDKSLSVWVKCQRRQMKVLKLKGKSTLTLERKEALDKMGFNWNPRNL